jgi:hypothetical protein
VITTMEPSPDDESAAPADEHHPAQAVDRVPSVRALAVGRSAVAAVMFLRPGWSGRMWLGGPDTPSRRRLMLAIGLRDVVLGLGTLMGRRPRRWLLAGAVADGADALVSVAAGVRTHRRRTAATAIVAASSAVLGGALVRRAS